MVAGLLPIPSASITPSEVFLNLRLNWYPDCGSGPKTVRIAWPSWLEIWPSQSSFFSLIRNSGQAASQYTIFRRPFISWTSRLASHWSLFCKPEDAPGLTRCRRDHRGFSVQMPRRSGHSAGVFRLLMSCWEIYRIPHSQNISIPSPKHNEETIDARQ